MGTMTQYFNQEKDNFDLESCEIDSIKRSIYHKMLVRSSSSEFETLNLRKFFQYYDQHRCRHVDYENFMNVMDRMGVIPKEYSNLEKYKKYFNKLSKGKKYINYHQFINSLQNCVYPPQCLDIIKTEN